MRVALIEPGAAGFHVFSGIRLPRLGLPTLAALAKAGGHDAVVFCEDLAPIDDQAVERADVVGISTTTSTAPRAYELADRLRARGCFVVIGGPHATFMPEEALEHADVVVRGEGEEAFVELLEALERGGGLERIRGISLRVGRTATVRHNPARPCLRDLDELPHPDLAAIRGSERMRVTPVMTSRGCPHACRFCSVTRMFGRRYRARSVASVLDELRARQSRFVFFYDDNFAADRRRLDELCAAIAASGMRFRWSAQVRLDIARHPRLLARMRDAGCALVHVGIESIDPAALDTLGKRQGVDDPGAAIAEFRRAGIDVHGMLIFGTDADTPASLRATAAFCREARLFTVQFLALTPLPGTPLFDEFEREGRLLTRNWRLFDGHHVVHAPARMSPYELQREIIAATVRFYSSWRVLARLVSFRWVHAYYLMSGRRKMKRWLRANRELVESLRSAASRVTSPAGR